MVCAHGCVPLMTIPAAAQGPRRRLRSSVWFTVVWSVGVRECGGGGVGVRVGANGFRTPASHRIGSLGEPAAGRRRRLDGVVIDPEPHQVGVKSLAAGLQKREM